MGEEFHKRLLRLEQHGIAKNPENDGVETTEVATGSEKYRGPLGVSR